MPCCFVLRFQGKARSERAERKVSTALIRSWRFGFVGGKTMRAWDLIFFFLFSFTNTLALGRLRVYRSTCYWLSSHIHADTLEHTRTHVHNGIAPPDGLLGEISTQFSNTTHSGEWVTLDEVIAFPTCPLHLSCLLYLISRGLISPCLRLVSHSALFAPLTGRSDVDNSVFEDRLNFCVYGHWLCVPPSRTTEADELRVIKALFSSSPDCFSLWRVIVDHIFARCHPSYR